MPRSSQRNKKQTKPGRKQIARQRQGGRGAADRKGRTGGRKNSWIRFALPAREFGISVALAVAERWGADAEVRWARLEQSAARPGMRPKTTLLGKTTAENLARLLAGLAHPDRVRLARAIITGAKNHKLLSESVGLKTGPLYHHVRELERAGLVATTSRNAYVLTELGRVVLLVATALGVDAGTEAKKTWHVDRRKDLLRN